MPQFAFLSERSSKKVLDDNFKEVEGHVLKRFVSVVTCHKVLYLNLPTLTWTCALKRIWEDYFYNKLGVFKYEKPLPLDNSIVGDYPAFTIKTDSERVQNLSDEILQKLAKLGT